MTKTMMSYDLSDWKGSRVMTSYHYIDEMTSSQFINDSLNLFYNLKIISSASVRWNIELDNMLAT